jgi:hypothetical protein
MAEKLKKLRIGKKNHPFHQPIRRQHTDIRCNNQSNILTGSKHMISLVILKKIGGSATTR